MDAKYIGKAVNLPKEAHEQLEGVRAELHASLGFEPSLTETIQYLIKQHNDRKADA